MNKKTYFGGMAALFAALIAFAGGGCYNPYLAIREAPNLTIKLTRAGVVKGDSVSISPAKGKPGDIITIKYTLAITGSEDTLAFSGTEIRIATIKADKNGTNHDSLYGTIQYMISKADAGKDNVINIRALFSHSPQDIPPPPDIPDIEVKIETEGDFAEDKGDNIFCAPEAGKPDDIITISYTLAITRLHNSVTFSGTPSAPIEGSNDVIGPDEPVTRTVPYKISAADADDGVVTIKASFYHGDLIPETIAFDNDDKDESVPFGRGSFTNAVTRNTGEPANKNPITYSIDLSKSDKDVVLLIEQTGEVIFIKAGVVTITATKESDGTYSGHTASYKLSIEVQPEYMEFPEGEVTVTYEDGLILPAGHNLLDMTGLDNGNTRPIIWSSAPSSVAWVDPVTGAVYIEQAGTVIITATKESDGKYSGAEAYYTLIVAPQEEQDDYIEFELPSVTVFENETVTNPLIDGQGSGAITYISDDPSVAIVDPNTGSVTIVGTGSTTITATKAGDGIYKEAKAEFTLTVNPPVTDRIPLSISRPTGIWDKLYDGNNLVNGDGIVTLGTVSGVQGSHDVKVSAFATYDNEEEGSGKPITIVYSISGADKNLYNPPVTDTAFTGTIYPDPNLSYRKTVINFNNDPKGETHYNSTNHGEQNGKIYSAELEFVDEVVSKTPDKGISLQITTVQRPGADRGEGWNEAPIIPINLAYPLDHYQSISVDVKVLAVNTELAGGDNTPNHQNKSIYAYAALDNSSNSSADTFKPYSFGNPGSNTTYNFADLFLGRSDRVEDLDDLKNSGIWKTIEIPIAEIMDNVENPPVRVPLGANAPWKEKNIYLCIGFNIGKETVYLMDNITFELKDGYTGASPKPAAFNLNSGTQQSNDIYVTLTDSYKTEAPFALSVSKVTAPAAALAPGTDYTVNGDGHVVTLKKEYLRNLTVGPQEFAFNINGKNATCVIDVKDTSSALALAFDQSGMVSYVQSNVPNQAGNFPLTTAPNSFTVTGGTHTNGTAFLQFAVTLPGGTKLSDYDRVSFEFTYNMHTNWGSQPAYLLANDGPMGGMNNPNFVPYRLGSIPMTNPAGPTETYTFSISAATPGANSNVVYFGIQTGFAPSLDYTVRNFTLE